MFEPFQNFMTRAAAAYGVQTEVQAAEVCQKFRSLIPELFPGKESVEEYIEAGHFKKGVFVIKVDNMAWAQEIVVRKEKIIRAMNDKIGKEMIKNLRAELK